MTRKRVTDGQHRMLVDRTRELERRVDEGTLPFDATMKGLQRLIEVGDDDPPMPTEPVWEIQVDRRESVESMFKERRIPHQMEDPYGYLTSSRFPREMNLRSYSADVQFVAFRRPVPLSEAPERLLLHDYRLLYMHEALTFIDGSRQAFDRRPIVVSEYDSCNLVEKKAVMPCFFLHGSTSYLELLPVAGGEFAFRSFLVQRM